MSKISVFTSFGQWSSPICGLDKVHLMWSAIKREYIQTDYYKTMGDEYNPDYGITCELKNLEIDNQKITTDSIFYNPEDGSINWISTSLSRAKSFKMRLCTLQQMAEEDKYASAMYNALIKAAQIPSPAPTNYCLMFKFEDE